jgi:hypothetical protein
MAGPGKHNIDSPAQQSKLLGRFAPKGIIAINLT